MSRNDAIDKINKEIRNNKRLVIFLCVLLALNIIVSVWKFMPKSGNEMILAAPADSGTSTIKMILFVGQWVALVALAVFIYIKYLQKKRQQNVKIDLSEFEKFKNIKSGTDIDVLFSILQVKDELSLPVVEKIFNIDKEKALIWGKILEDHNLIVINYPVFSEPVFKRRS